MASKALVTGASRGIGAAIARELAKAGYDVTVNFIEQRDKANAVASEINGRVYQCDVSDPVAVAKMVEECGPFDVLVNNAGIAEQIQFQDISKENGIECLLLI